MPALDAEGDGEGARTRDLDLVLGTAVDPHLCGRLAGSAHVQLERTSAVDPEGRGALHHRAPSPALAQNRATGGGLGNRRRSDLALPLKNLTVSSPAAGGSPAPAGRATRTRPRANSAGGRPRGGRRPRARRACRSPRGRRVATRRRRGGSSGSRSRPHSSARSSSTRLAARAEPGGRSSRTRSRSGRPARRGEARARAPAEHP